MIPVMILCELLYWNMVRSGSNRSVVAYADVQVDHGFCELPKVTVSINNYLH
jgi:hypothetical protein